MKHRSSLRRPGCLSAAVVLLCHISLATAGEPYDVPLDNPDFRGEVDRRGTPAGWSRYGGGGQGQDLQLASGPGEAKAKSEAKMLLIADGDSTSEIGVSQTVGLQGDETYQVTAKVLAVKGASSRGAYLQLRFLPSQQLVQTDLRAKSTDEFTQVAVKGTAPPNTTHGVIYLYTHREPTPQVYVTDVRLTGGLPAPPPPPPAPIPPQYDRLKDLYLEIPLVRSGQARSAIVAPSSGIYQESAIAIQAAIQSSSGVDVPVVSDDSPQAAVPPLTNLIVLGNRSTNRTMNALYDCYYCLADLKYPGPEGYLLRTVHNPFGNGQSVVVVGGSDAVGVEAGARQLAKDLMAGEGRSGDLSIGWTMQTRLGRGVVPPQDIRDFETWEASRGYGSVGYFGWTSISKRMAMYYMTGDEFNAREVVRLAFPDDQAIREIEEIDGERIENKRDPLAGFYHYNAHIAILFWDLIEESPVFTDEERLQITNAFARQLNHRKDEGVYGLTQPPRAVGSRHGQWSAISLYCLGRYFAKDYPDPVWAQCVRGGELAFQSLHEHAWVAGESDNLFWYNTGIAPIFTYLTLTGDRKPLESGIVGRLLRGQEALISGRDKDWALNSASLGYLHKAAYLTGDGRWISYRERTGVDTSVFRLGQSYWPDELLPPVLPEDLVGRWTIHRLPEPAWGSRGSGLPLDQSFYFASFRSAPDGSGDFILLDGFNGASRNPYHTFDILQLRLAGQTVLDGYHNQVLTSADGMVEPAVAMDAALLHADVVGSTASAVGEVPDAAFCNWRRMLVQRVGRYAMIVDDLAFRTDSRNMTVTTTWQTSGGRWDPQSQAIRLPAVRRELRGCDLQAVRPGGVVSMDWTGPVQQGGHRFAFYLIGQTPDDPAESLACVRIADNAAALQLPEPGLVTAGEFGSTRGELVIWTQDHLYGHGLLRAGIEDAIVASDTLVELDWDFSTGVVHVVADNPASLRIRLASTDPLRVDDAKRTIEVEQGVGTIALSAGRHVLTGATLPADQLSDAKLYFDRLLIAGRHRRVVDIANSERTTDAGVGELPTAMIARLESAISGMTVVPAADGPQLAVAVGDAVHLLTLDGRTNRILQTDDTIRVLHWWDDPQLLLVGCVDEQVIAFDREGNRRWAFTSQMDPAVYAAAKTYWFKSAPGHAGIHGLYTGEFDDGQNRCFVGSACTLEILDRTGGLVKRTPVFWGPGRMFALVPGPEGSRNLLISRWPNGNDHLAIVNSRSMQVTGSGFHGVPTGHAFVGGWTAQNRTGLFHADLDGDGRNEIASAINGTWNRVTVYTEDGTPKYNAQFGPGSSNAPRSRMRDMDLADLDKNGKLEILVGLAEGLVVALDHQCRKIWSARTPSPPRCLRCADASDGSTSITVACDDGTVWSLDGDGNVTAEAKIAGRPVELHVVETSTGPLTVVATDRGQVFGVRARR